MRKARVIISPAFRRSVGWVTSHRLSPALPSAVRISSIRVVSPNPGSACNSIRSILPFLPEIAWSAGRSMTKRVSGASGRPCAEGMIPAISRSICISRMITGKWSPIPNRFRFANALETKTLRGFRKAFQNPSAALPISDPWPNQPAAPCPDGEPFRMATRSIPKTV